ncbi:MAG: glycoside hydrolase [Ferruginibacter sp.]|nr:glycoside hydrolase [Ferruginibacter sp.]
MKKITVCLIVAVAIFTDGWAQTAHRKTENFNKNWKFILDNVNDYSKASANVSNWRLLNLPHDWSIEMPFDSTSPTGTGGGALRGGIGWYNKSFSIPFSAKDKKISIDFDGVYHHSEVWINGHYLGLRPYGFSSFRYDLTPYLLYGGGKNTITVKVDNSKQPNSRWYSGSGIYRNVWLVTTDKISIDHWGTFVTTPVITPQSATIHVNTHVRNTTNTPKNISLTTIIYDKDGREAARKTSSGISLTDPVTKVEQDLKVPAPKLWSVANPYLYKAVSQVSIDGKIVDDYITPLGIRSFEFDVNKGFLLNGKSLKINGVCNHHDLGCLGAAINTRALERQLEILKAMGCNGIRTSHNPPTPELLDLCDKMGFIVMDEAFDMWKKQKNPFDYHLYWDEWHRADLEDLVKRDRNHPSVFIWSIGNEILEQWDSTGIPIAKELAGIVKALDPTRPVTSALNDPQPGNKIYQSGALDLVGFNYHHQDFAGFQKAFPGKKFIATETVSALQTRGHYDLIPSDSIRRWPERWDKPFTKGNPDLTVSAYDNVSAPWGSTHEETLKEIKKHDFLSGQFIWTGFDYIGEPTPYPWPARSSYFGIIDLAGFPKDVYYMYQTEWTNKDVLHIFPHWNWKQGDTVDIWAYYSNADEVELFLNGKSLGNKKKQGDAMHVTWKVNYTPGMLKAISRKNGRIVLTKEIKTAGMPAKIILTADRKLISADGNDLSYITAKVVDANGVMVPGADNLIAFTVAGNAKVIATDNGSPTSMESFKATKHKAFNGLCLAVIQSGEKAGVVTVTATAEGLAPASITINTK